MADVPSQAVTRCHRLSQGLSQAVTGAVTGCHRDCQAISIGYSIPEPTPRP